MNETKIICDCCGEQLNIDSLYPHNWGLKLSPHDYGINTSGMEYAIAQYPAIDKEIDLCGFRCLRKWLDSESQKIGKIWKTG